MAGEWWDFGDFNLGGGGGGGYDPSWFNFDPGMFNLDFSFPEWSIPNFDFGFDPSQFNLGFDPSMFSMPDPLALPSYDSFFTGSQDFSQFGIPDQGMQGFGGGSPMSLADLGFGGTSAPSMALPEAGMAQGTDPLTNLMGTDQGQGFNPFMGEQYTGLDDMGLGQTSAVPGGSAYATPFSNQLNLGQYEGPSGTQGAEQGTTPGTSKWDVIAKLAQAFGPTAIGAAGMGLQAANRPERNPLEDDLLRARIASSGTQDALARDRLAFEKENAGAMMEHQAGLQEAMLESRKPGGQANITALLQGNPQLAALYQALTNQTTGLASGSGSPEFNALIDQIAQVDIAELNKQAQQEIDQAMELQARQGINPANIIAKIKERVLQESAKARANARATLIQQLQPGINTFNSIGSLFGNLFQTPSA